MPAPSFSRETAIRSLRTHDSMALLRANLKEEHILKMDWILTLFKHTLTPPQVARLLVQVCSPAAIHWDSVAFSLQMLLQLRTYELK